VACVLLASLSVTWLCPAKVAVQIEVLFGVETLPNPRNIVLDSGPGPLR